MRVVIGLGSNVGRRLENLQGAIDTLFDAPGLEFVAVSSVYETDPVGGPEQGLFLNAVVIGETTLDPRTLLDRALGVENAFGRVRAERWGPRTLDLDLLVQGTARVADEQLTLPHPGIAERAFVLYPLADIAPDLEVPGVGRVADLLARVGGEGIRALDA